MKSFSFGSSFFARPSFGKWPSDPNASGVSVEDDDDDDVLYEGVIFAWCAQLCSFTVFENHPKKKPHFAKKIVKNQYFSLQFTVTLERKFK